jgi:hypothetical protein
MSTDRSTLIHHGMNAYKVDTHRICPSLQRDASKGSTQLHEKVTLKYRCSQNAPMILFLEHSLSPKCLYGLKCHISRAFEQGDTYNLKYDVLWLKSINCGSVYRHCHEQVECYEPCYKYIRHTVNASSMALIW